MTKKLVLCCALLLAIAGCSKKSGKWEVLIHAGGGHIENTRLVLDNTDPRVVSFTVGKPRKSITVSLQDLINDWDTLFASSAPNATLSMRTANKEQKEQVVILKKPQLLGRQLIFTIEQTGYPIEESFSDAVLFIDQMCWQNQMGSTDCV